MMVWFSWLYVFLFQSFLFTHVSSSSLSSTPPSASPSCHHGDRSALFQFNKSFSIDDTICLRPPTPMSLENGTDCCGWNGVTCDTITGRVIGLDLYCGGLHGMIYSNSSLFQLSHLKTLNLSYNDFRGSNIPAEFGKFAHLLNLEIMNANFSGDIPPEISYLSKLQTFSLEADLYGQRLRLNAFSFGRIATNLTDLQVLGLRGVDMSEVEPVSLMNLSSSSLTSLTIANCELQGNFLWHDKSFGPELYYLDLSDNWLNGTIPNWLYSLPSLRFLYLGNNRFTGQIHEFLTTSFVELDLSNNMLHGSIPVSVFQQVNLSLLTLQSNYFSGFCSVHSNHSLAAPRILPYLEWLDLSHNQIKGEVPKWLWNVGTDSLYFLGLSYNSLTNIEQIPWRNLQYLELHSNRITGEVPSSICKLRSLEVLDLANNTLNGKLPSCMGTLSGNLSVLDMRMNKLHGMIPVTLFGKKSALRTLNFNGNQLEGLLPPSLLNCKKLQVLDIGNNMINGTFPHWLESLPLLQVLILRSNKFHGSIPNPMVRFPFQKLRILDLSENEFNGNLPAKLLENLRAIMEINTTKGLEYMGDAYYQDFVFLEMKGNFVVLVKILTILTTIDLSRNNFEGEIPKSIGKLKSLKGLNFSHNKLNGFIPPSLGNLSELESLDLSSNVLVGTIPQQLIDITSLEVLNLAENRLVGHIPRGKQFDTFENNSYRGNLDLCGFPLSKLCEAQQPSFAHFQQDSSAHFQQEGEYELANWLEWMIVSIGFGCGMVIGISIGYMVLSEKRIAQLMRYTGEEQLSKLLKRFKHKAR